MKKLLLASLVSGGLVLSGTALANSKQCDITKNDVDVTNFVNKIENGPLANGNHYHLSAKGGHEYLEFASGFSGSVNVPVSNSQHCSDQAIHNVIKSKIDEQTAEVHFSTGKSPYLYHWEGKLNLGNNQATYWITNTSAVRTPNLSGDQMSGKFPIQITISGTNQVHYTVPEFKVSQ